MSKVDADWQQEILLRFDGRKNLTNDELYAHYFESRGTQYSKGQELGVRPAICDSGTDTEIDGFEFSARTGLI